MNLRLRPIESLAESLTLAPEIEARAREEELFEALHPAPEGFVGRFLERHFDRKETLVVVAEGEGAGVLPAVCVTAPFEDPLRGAVLPVIVVLFVDPRIRHRGVARALVQEASRLLRARGLKRLAARASHNDDALVSMGERWGFVREWEWMVLE